MPPPRRVSTTTELGNVSGTTFNDSLHIPDLDSAVITRIVVSYDGNLRSFAVHYNSVAGVSRGTVVGTQSELSLASGEYISAVKGHWNGNAITALTMETSKGRKWGPFPQALSTMNLSWNFEQGMGLLYFNGSGDGYFRSLRAAYTTYVAHPERPVTLKFEKQASQEPISQPAAPLTSFARNLMADPVTLIIGTAKMRFIASQHTLTLLPFFRAALNGPFVESASQTITMPEDDPQTVAALIEFLYTGSYTFPYISTTDESVPAPDLAEGHYHVGVYATAHKYGCETLVDAALSNFVYVIGQLQGIDVVRLLCVAYGKGLTVELVAERDDCLLFGKGLLESVRGWYSGHREEMETVADDWPRLVSDILRLAAVE